MDHVEKSTVDFILHLKFGYFTLCYKMDFEIYEDLMLFPSLKNMNI